MTDHVAVYGCLDVKEWHKQFKDTYMYKKYGLHYACKMLLLTAQFDLSIGENEEAYININRVKYLLTGDIDED